MKSRNRETQRRIAYEAARIMTDGRFVDQSYAIHKAADRLGINNKRLMPNREEVETALREQQRLFRGDEQQTIVAKMRSAAFQAMKALDQFKPLLVGAALDGTADKNSRIRLHLYATTPEDVLLNLMEMRIPCHEKDCSIKFSDGSRKFMPNYSFIADGNTFELIILPDTGLQNRPIDPQDDRPIKGITTQQLERLLTHR